jgi:secreted PhoX family phosphatase
MNHEYTDDGLLFPDGKSHWTAEKVHKAQAAHGVAVIEVAFREGRWQMVRPSNYARRYTARTPFAVGGPAAGHPGRHRDEAVIAVAPRDVAQAAGRIGQPVQQHHRTSRARYIIRP